MLPGVIPSLSNDAEFFPGLSKSWALTFMVNDEEAPTGRPAGALGWAGLANLFYWIDRQNGFVSGQHRFFRSEIPCRSAGTSTSKPPCTTACGSRRPPDVRMARPPR